MPAGTCPASWSSSGRPCLSTFSAGRGAPFSARRSLSSRNGAPRRQSGRGETITGGKWIIVHLSSSYIISRLLEKAPGFEFNRPRYLTAKVKTEDNPEETLFYLTCIHLGNGPNFISLPTIHPPFCSAKIFWSEARRNFENKRGSFPLVWYEHTTGQLRKYRDDNKPLNILISVLVWGL